MNASTESIGDEGSLGPEPVTLLIEQRRRWRRGERIVVEELCRLFPLTPVDNETVLDLIYQEVLLREEIGEQPSVDQYVLRFPHLSDQLRLQFELAALRVQLRQRGLDWEPDDATQPTAENRGKRIDEVRLLTDERFIELGRTIRWPATTWPGCWRPGRFPCATR